MHVCAGGIVPDSNDQRQEPTELADRPKIGPLRLPGRAIGHRCGARQPDDQHGSRGTWSPDHPGRPRLHRPFAEELVIGASDGAFFDDDPVAGNQRYPAA